jgi:lipoprotein-releasing system permease protein
MNFEHFIAKRISFQSKRSFSKMIVRIAITGIALGIAVMILSLAVIRGFKSTIQDKLRNFAGDIQISKIQLANNPENSFIYQSDSLSTALKNNTGIAHYNEFASKVGVLRMGSQMDPIVLKGLGENYHASFYQSILTQGRLFQQANEIIISKDLANRYQVALNTSLYIYFADEQLKIRKLKVVGIFDSGIDQLDRMYIISSIDIIKSVNNWQHKEIGGYEIYANQRMPDEQLMNQLNASLSFDAYAQTVTTLYPSMFEWLALLDVNGQVIIILMLLVAGINMISALLIIILERSATIGLLKTLGAKNISIQKIFLWNAGYLITYGLLIGNAIALFISFIQIKTHILKLDQTNYYMSYVPIELSFSDIIYLNLGALVACILMVVIPSFLITKITAIKAIRFN